MQGNLNAFLDGECKHLSSLSTMAAVFLDRTEQEASRSQPIFGPPDGEKQGTLLSLRYKLSFNDSYCAATFLSSFLRLLIPGQLRSTLSQSCPSQYMIELVTNTAEVGQKPCLNIKFYQYVQVEGVLPEGGHGVSISKNGSQIVVKPIRQDWKVIIFYSNLF